ncbi:hypothetical protein TRSA_26660 (plasmid) [Treponema saccharophilum]|uniref:Uncharacterized protein n=1 Tax=Treponema saccharophilum DSM 2985 TaxID=907348 RepID=H7EM47_9SPIR|nr:hypothetical protein TresaDRAFT_1347 [Treponema saccharophilum DSM 2985]BDC97567.1 hypothetical protein TRSA_26660 [Treponema saccharophilum]
MKAKKIIFIALAVILQMALCSHAGVVIGLPVFFAV